MATLVPRLEARKLTKSFSGVRAVSQADLVVMPHEIHALVGENGSGKSTLCMTLSGVYQPDSGEVHVDGVRVMPENPRHAQSLGISMMYQESNLVPELNVAANIALGHESFIVDKREIEARAREILNRLEFSLDLGMKAAKLSGAQLQMAEIAKALYGRSKVIIMDEPTAALSLVEARALHKVIRDIAKSGVSVIYISHALEEALDLADNITVLRDGQVVACQPTKTLTRADLVQLMVGRAVTTLGRRSPISAGEEVLRVEGLTLGQRVRDVTFDLRRGEIVGLAGLVGSGRSELASMVVGLARPTAGRIVVHGKPTRIRSPRHANSLGIAYLSENRKEDGLFLQLSVLTNLTISVLHRLSRFLGIVSRHREVEVGRAMISRFAISAPGLRAKMQTLSGGNQQKSLIARLLETKPEIVLFDEPTKGVDVGAIEQIHRTIRSLADEGKAVLVISSYLPEVLALSDRVLVMRAGQLAADLSADGISEDRVMAAAFG